MMVENKTLKPWDSGIPYYMPNPMNDWEDSGFACEKCGGEMQRNNGLILASNPPMHEYRCKVCGHVDYRYQ